MPRYTETGPPKSGKTARLIDKANRAKDEGRDVTFVTSEIPSAVLRRRGLQQDIPIEIGDEEAVEVK